MNHATESPVLDPLSLELLALLEDADPENCGEHGRRSEEATIHTRIDRF